MSKLSTKRKQQEKSNHFPRKPKTVLKLVVGLKAETKKAATALRLGKGKGFMRGPTPVAEKPSILLREDSKYTLEKFLSIITSNDYEDLSNHATETMGEIGLFNIAQVTCSSPLFFFPSTCLVFNLALLSGNVNDEGLMGRRLNHKTALDRIRAKASSMEDELNELKA